MEFKEALDLVKQAFNQGGMNINDLQFKFFEGVWEDLTYKQIAEREGYAEGTIAKDVAPKFWNLLKKELGEKVGKTNFREPLKRYRDRQKNNLPRPIPEPSPPPEPQPPRNILNENKEFKAFKIIIDTIKIQKNKEIDVTTISANNYDLFIKVDEISPEHESVILKKSFACGGSGANTVCGLSKLGKKTAIVGCVKNDFEGEELFNSFRDFSVDTEFLISDDNTNARNTKTGSTIVLVERISARRQILVEPGINNYLSEILRENNEQRLEALVMKVKKSKILHLSSFAGQAEMELQLTVLDEIKNDNIMVSLTPGAIYVEGGLDKLNKILACTNILFLYIQQLDRLLKRSSEIEGFERHLSLEEKIKLFFEWRIKKQMTHALILVIKNYSKSRANTIYKNHILVASHFDTCVSFFKHSSEKFNDQNRNSTFFIPEDSTGTGDALAAGFLYGILEGKDIEICTDFGFIMSREVSQRLGARSNLPDENSLRGYLVKKLNSASK